MKDKVQKEISVFSPILEISIPTDHRRDAREISKTILVLLAAGAIISSALVAPGASGAVAKLLKSLLDQPWRKRRVLHRLQRLRYVQIEDRAGQHVLTLTKLGRKISRNASLDNIEIQRPKHWDKQWRILVFDIPERKRLERDILRAKIRQLGFREFQRSVWVLPWPCRPEIQFITELYSLQHYLGFWEVPDGPEFLHFYQNFDLK